MAPDTARSLTGMLETSSNSGTNQAIDAHKSYNMIENLPVELRIMLLKAVPKLQHRKLLCEASTVYRESYRTYQMEIINAIHGTNFQPDLLPELEMWRCAVASAKDADARDFEDTVKDFYDCYRERRQKASTHYKTGRRYDAGDIERFLLSLTRKERERLVRLQRSIDYYVSAFLSWYVRKNNVRGMFYQRVPSSSTQSWTSGLTELSGYPGKVRRLSPNEVRRLQRACYRIEMFHIFCKAQVRLQKEEDIFDDQSLQPELCISEWKWAGLFQKVFKPWELEEMVCVWSFLTARYRNICHQLASDVYTNFPGFADISAANNISINDERVRVEAINYWIHAGFRWFEYMDQYFKEEKRERRPFKWSYWLRPQPLYMSLWRVLTVGSTLTQHHTKPRPLKFRGDRNIDGPNVMWVEANGGKDQAQYFQDRGDVLRHWDYVFWDKERLGDWGGFLRDKSSGTGKKAPKEGEVGVCGAWRGF